MVEHMKISPNDSSTEEESTAGESFKRRRWYNQRDVKFIAAVIIFVVVFQGYGFYTGPSRIGINLQQAIETGDKKLDILVWANFPAEAFHMELYQKLGAIRGEQEGAVRLGGIRPRDVKFLSRKYWIKNMEIAPPEE